MLKKYTIYGERCSGTNYLENIININFDVKITWEYGWKHFFGFEDVDGSSRAIFDKSSKFILFVSIISDSLCGIFNSFLSSSIHSRKASKLLLKLR